MITVTGSVEHPPLGEGLEPDDPGVSEQAMSDFSADANTDVPAARFERVAANESAAQLDYTEGEDLIATAYVDEVDEVPYVSQLAACESVLHPTQGEGAAE